MLLPFWYRSAEDAIDNFKSNYDDINLPAPAEPPAAGGAEGRAAQFCGMAGRQRWYSDGMQPTMRLNTFAKYYWSLKPTISAIWYILYFFSSSNSFARCMRCRLRYSLTLMPVSALNICPK